MTESSVAEPTLLSSLQEDQLGSSHDLRLLGRLLPHLRGQLGLLVVALVLMPATSLASLVQPYLTKLAVDAALTERSGPALQQVVIWFAVALALEFAARFGQIYTMQLAGQRAMAGLRMTVFRHIQRLHISYLDRTPTGRIVTRYSIFSTGRTLRSWTSVPPRGW